MMALNGDVQMVAFVVKTLLLLQFLFLSSIFR